MIESNYLVGDCAPQKKAGKAERDVRWSKREIYANRVTRGTSLNRARSSFFFSLFLPAFFTLVSFPPGAVNWPVRLGGSAGMNPVISDPVLRRFTRNKTKTIYSARALACVISIIQANGPRAFALLGRYVENNDPPHCSRNHDILLCIYASVW